MEILNEWAKANLGNWAVDYSALYLLIAAALAFIFLTILFTVLVRHIQIRKKTKKLKEQIAEAKAAQYFNYKYNGKTQTNDADY